MLSKPESTEALQDDALKAPLLAARAAESKKALDLRLFDLRGVSSFTDFFLVCSGSNSRQIQAIADEIGLELKKAGELPLGMEGYDAAEWILVDFGNFLVHVFSEKARGFYDLERLWRQAKEIKLTEGVPEA